MMRLFHFCIAKSINNVITHTSGIQQKLNRAKTWHPRPPTCQTNKKPHTHTHTHRQVTLIGSKMQQDTSHNDTSRNIRVLNKTTLLGSKMLPTHVNNITGLQNTTQMQKHTHALADPEHVKITSSKYTSGCRIGLQNLQKIYPKSIQHRFVWIHMVCWGFRHAQSF